MSSNGADTEFQEVLGLVRRYVAMPASVEGVPARRPQQCYATIYGGEAVRNAKKIAAQVTFQEFDSPDEAAEEVLRRIRVARGEGTRRLWVRIYKHGDSGIVDSLEVSGDPNAPRQIEDSDTSSMGAAHAAVVLGCHAELRYAYGLTVEAARDIVELATHRAALETELRVRQEVGWALGVGHAVDRATSNLAPHLAQVAEVIRAIRGLPAAGAAPPSADPNGASDHATNVRARMTGLEAAANELGAAVQAAHAAGAIDEPLRAELASRIAALVAAFRVTS